MHKAELAEILGDGHPALAPIEEHLWALANEPDLPATSVAACAARIEEVAPAIRQVLGRAADGEALSNPEAALLFRGLHILGGAREVEAFPLLLRLLSRPSDELDDLLGDAITESLESIIIGVFDGDAEALFAAINGRDVDEYVRAALIGAASFLTWTGLIPLERMVTGLEQFDDERLADKADFAWIAWVDAIGRLGLRPMAGRVAQAFRDGRVPTDQMAFEGFEADLAEAEANLEDSGRFERVGLGYISDTLDVLQRFDGGGAGEWPDEPSPTQTVTNPFRQIGRNDPCPCGSGKKAKKCCLSNA